MLLFGDYVILLISALFGVIGILLGTNTLYKIYFGMIFGFLLFLVFNLEIKVLELERPKQLTSLEDFLMKNKGFCLGMSAISVFIIGISFSIGGTKSKGSIISNFILGFFLFIFYIGINSYILDNSVVKLVFLDDILSFFKGTNIYILFLNRPHYIFLLMIFVLFGKIINLLAIGFGAYLIELIKNITGNIKERQNEIDSLQEELDEENRKKRLLW